MGTLGIFSDKIEDSISINSRDYKPAHSEALHASIYKLQSNNNI